MIKYIGILTLLSVCLSTTFAQKNTEYKPTKITVEDLQKKVYTIDSNATAVVLTDVGKSEIVGNKKESFSLHFKRFKRVHILKNSAYDKANIIVPLYVDGQSEEVLTDIKAVTYNLENGQIVETKLGKDGVFTNKQDKNHLQKRFTLPNVKEGSIIEFEYTLVSDFLFNLQPWAFQDDVPQLWSEYRLSIPDFLRYVFITKGYLPYAVNDRQTRKEIYSVVESNGASASKTYHITSGVTDFKWVIKDAPALKEEKYTSTVKNHLSSVQFQLSEYKEPYVEKKIMSSWPVAVKNLMEREDFGRHLTNSNFWLNDDVKAITEGAANSNEKARKIYAYVRDHITCTEFNGLLLEQSLKDVLKKGKGIVSEINMLLIAMLKNAGIQADPVMLSTRGHGETYPIYPIINQYNYLVCLAKIDGKSYYLDASHPRLGFGALPVECYTNTARLLNTDATAINFKADSVKERKITTLFLYNKENQGWKGAYNEILGSAESFNMRDHIQQKGAEEIIKDIKKGYNFEVDVTNAQFDSLDKYEMPLAIKYDIDIKNEGEDIIYLNPMLGVGYKENPFKSAERQYPVEMPYTMDETYVLSLDVPKGYVVDELPKGLRVKLNEEGEGEFEYLLAQQNDKILLRSRVKFSRATFLPEEYVQLREFYNLIVNKHNEQIVFKKKS